MKKILCLLGAAAFTGLVACADKPVLQGDYGVVPLPREVNLTGGEAYLLNTSSITIGYPEANPGLEQNARFLASYLNGITGKEPKLTTGAGDITLSLDASISNKEGYRLTVGKADGVQIAGSTEAGVFYGIQTLRKSLPAVTNGSNVELPAVTINDFPRFGYRGMHLDVSRHFSPVEDVKTFIDILALHNLNTFHWHLIDDQGWRIEIKKYPELTQTGAVRKETVIGRNSGEYDGKPYGPYFYTQDQIKEVIAYAAQQHITIIPEIDLPGHQQAVLATYPEYGCTGGPYEVWTEWGVSEEVICAGNDKAISFLEDVLAEVIDLFPSEYIHIGGDECPKVRWEKCPKCQAKIKELGIKGDAKHTKEEYLQSYVINRMEQFVESKGRHIIGWDEILEGGLAPNATVMSWRGTEGGIEAAKQHHNVIMTPTTYLYFDYYQATDTENEPFAIGGYVPLEMVYSFDPTAGIPEENQKYVIGVQANLWREYIPDLNQIEYMILPRMDALADIQWSDPAQKDYQAFLHRVARMTKIYDHLGYNYAKHIFDVNADLEPTTADNSLKITLSTLGEGDIYYTLDGSEPTATSTKYEGPVTVKQNADFKALVIRPNGSKSRIFEESIYFNKATMKPITLKNQPSRQYAYNGAPALADGLRGGENYKTGRWLGFSGRDVDATIDLQEATEISKVYFNANVVKGDWIMGPSGVTVKVSDDGQNFREIATKSIPQLAQKDKDGVYPYAISFEPVTTRYVEVIINHSPLPAWHPGAGRRAYVFVDEIGID